jgi:GDPmannose 4,6-dehydratase
VTRKITRSAAKISLGLSDCLYLGNLDSKRDWGHAKDYVEAMYLMLQQEKAEDFVISTGITTLVRDFVFKAFKRAGIEVTFEGKGIDEIGIVASSESEHVKKGDVIIKIDPRYFRPTEVDLLLGDSSKARTKLGWQPKFDLDSLVNEMVDSDIKLFEKDVYLREGGHSILDYHE